MKKALRKIIENRVREAAKIATQEDLREQCLKGLEEDSLESYNIFLDYCTRESMIMMIVEQVYIEAVGRDDDE